MVRQAQHPRLVKDREAERERVRDAERLLAAQRAQHQETIAKANKVATAPQCYGRAMGQRWKSADVRSPSQVRRCTNCRDVFSDPLESRTPRGTAWDVFNGKPLSGAHFFLECSIDKSGLRIYHGMHIF